MTPALGTRPISITLESRPVLSYAMAHNEIPVISRLAIDAVDRDVPAARLRLEVAEASGPIGEAQEILLDLEADRPTVLTDVTLRLDPAVMLRIEEQRPAVIRARLETDGRALAEQVVRTRVLAAHQWLATPLTLALSSAVSSRCRRRGIADEVRDVAGEPTGFGSVRVHVRIGETVWATSVFPEKDSGSYVLPVKKPVREKEGIEDGDRVTVTLDVPSR